MYIKKDSTKGIFYIKYVNFFTQDFDWLQQLY